jgi:hypothetical protein
MDANFAEFFSLFFSRNALSFWCNVLTPPSTARSKKSGDLFSGARNFFLRMRSAVGGVAAIEQPR